VIDLLIILLRPALRAVETDYSAWTWRDWLRWGAAFGWLDWLALLIAAPLDVLIAHTTWRLMAGPMLPTEWTISHTLERLCVTPGPDQQLYIEIAKKINRESPTGKHIKAMS
jgi:hypothetical protein